MLLAYGRDPYFAGWPDTLQLNYGNPALQEAMIGELVRIAGQCDGVRCDMAMLVLPDVFERTWGIRAELFWPKATEARARAASGFRFMAEVYWDLEWTMQQQGFDYAYDKRLYDRLREARPAGARALPAGLDYQDKLARFLENHDEPRAAATFPPDIHEAAAVITFLSPGLRFFHQGQFEGRTKRISPHLVRAPAEAVDDETEAVLRAIAGRAAPRCRSQWNLASARMRSGLGRQRVMGQLSRLQLGGNRRPTLLVAVNYAPNQSQCYVRLPHDDLRQGMWRLNDQMGEAAYERDGTDLIARGLYLDLPAWHYHVFHLERLAGETWSAYRLLLFRQARASQVCPQPLPTWGSEIPLA